MMILNWLTTLLYNMIHWLLQAWWWFPNTNSTPPLGHGRRPLGVMTTTSTAAAASGVNSQLIHTMNKLRNDELNIQRRWLDIGKSDPNASMLGDDRCMIHPKDAIFIVNKLCEILHQEEMDIMIQETMGKKKKYNNNNNNRQRRTGLYLNCNVFFSSSKALQIFCNFLKQTNHLSALHWDMMRHHPSAKFTIPILTSLHNNTSIHELFIHGDVFHDTASAAGLIKLLENKKNNLTCLVFSYNATMRSILPRILPLLGRMSHLRKLGFTSCHLDDHAIESIIEALVVVIMEDDNHNGRPTPSSRRRRLRITSHINDLDFSNNNDITSQGLLRSLCTHAHQFPNLHKLNLSGNLRLLDDDNITRVFVQTMLSSSSNQQQHSSLDSSSNNATMSSLKELYIANCAVKAYPLVIQALETNDTLEVLDISTHSYSNIYNGDNHNHHLEYPWQWDIRNQLVDSLPKIKGLVKLVLTDDIESLLDEQDVELMTAFHQNYSLVQIQKRHEEVDAADHRRHRRRSFIQEIPQHVLAILNRNKHFKNVESLLGRNLLLLPTPPTTTATPVEPAVSMVTTSNCIASSSVIMTLPPLCDGLWSHVLSTVGQGSDGAAIVFLLLQDQLATWQSHHKQQEEKEESTTKTATTTVSTTLPEMDKNKGSSIQVDDDDDDDDDDDMDTHISFRTTKGVFGSSNSSSSSLGIGNCKVLLGSSSSSSSNSSNNNNFVMHLHNHDTAAARRRQQQQQQRKRRQGLFPRIYSNPNCTFDLEKQLRRQKPAATTAACLV